MQFSRFACVQDISTWIDSVNQMFAGVTQTPHAQHRNKKIINEQLRYFERRLLHLML